MNFNGLQDELDELTELDKMNMVIVEDLLEVWEVAINAPDEIKEKLRLVTEEALQIYWGPQAWVELKDGSIFLKHKDGRNLEKFLAF